MNNEGNNKNNNVDHGHGQGQTCVMALSKNVANRARHFFRAHSFFRVPKARASGATPNNGGFKPRQARQAQLEQPSAREQEESDQRGEETVEEVPVLHGEEVTTKETDETRTTEETRTAANDGDIIVDLRRKHSHDTDPVAKRPLTSRRVRPKDGTTSEQKKLAVIVTQRWDGLKRVRIDASVLALSASVRGKEVPVWNWLLSPFFAWCAISGMHPMDTLSCTSTSFVVVPERSLELHGWKVPKPPGMPKYLEGPLLKGHNQMQKRHECHRKKAREQLAFDASKLIPADAVLSPGAKLPDFKLCEMPQLMSYDEFKVCFQQGIKLCWFVIHGMKDSETQDRRLDALNWMCEELREDTSLKEFWKKVCMFSEEGVALKQLLAGYTAEDVARTRAQPRSCGMRRKRKSSTQPLTKKFLPTRGHQSTQPLTKKVTPTRDNKEEGMLVDSDSEDDHQSCRKHNYVFKRLRKHGEKKERNTNKENSTNGEVEANNTGPNPNNETNNRKRKRMKTVCGEKTKRKRRKTNPANRDTRKNPPATTTGPTTDPHLRCEPR